MPRIIDNVPGRPSPTSWRYGRWLQAVRAYCLAQAPLTRAQTFYIAQSGSGSATGGGGLGTLASPFLVRDQADLNDLSGVILPWGSGTGDFALLLRCGDTFRPNSTTPQSKVGLTMSVGYVTIGNYVDSTITDARLRTRPPRLTAFTTPVTSGWTQANTISGTYAANWWYRDFTAATRPFGAQFSDADTSRGPDTDVFYHYDNRYGGNQGGPFSSATDTNLTGTILTSATNENAYAIVWDTGASQYRMYLKCATGNPNTSTSIEILQGLGAGINIGDVDNVRVDGIDADGFGYLNTSRSYSTQTPPFLTAVSGNKLTVFTNCRARFSGTHLLEQYGASDGGSSYWDNCVMSRATGGGNYNCTMMVGYCPTTNSIGANELFALNCRVTGGALPVDSFLNNSGAQIQCYFAHTGAYAYPPAMVVCANCTVEDNIRTAGNVAIKHFGGAFATPADPTNAAQYNAVCWGGRIGTGTNHIFLPDTGSITVNFKTGWTRFGDTNSATLHANCVNSLADWACAMVNCDILIDARQSTGTYLTLFGRASGTNVFTPHQTNCRWTVLTNEKNQCVEFANRFATSTTQGHGLTRLVNTEFYSSSAESGLQLANVVSNTMGFLNQTATAAQGGYLNCAFYYWQPVSVSNIIGYNSSSGFRDITNTTGFDTLPSMYQCHEALATLGTAHPIPGLDTDMDGNGIPRQGATRQIGPYMPLAQLNQAAGNAAGSGSTAAGFAAGLATGLSIGGA